MVLQLSCKKLKSCAAGAGECDGSCGCGGTHACAAYTQRFVTMLAGRTLAMNDRIQILSRPTLRGRYVRRAGKCFAIPFDRADMAAYLGTDRSALSRELGRMQREGLLRFRKNRFEILRTMDEE